MRRVQRLSLDNAVQEDLDARQAALRERDISADCLIGSLREADDHGLLDWCFRGNGQEESPFRELRAKRPAVWNACAHALE